MTVYQINNDDTNTAQRLAKQMYTICSSNKGPTALRAVHFMSTSDGNNRARKEKVQWYDFQSLNIQRSWLLISCIPFSS